MNQLLRLTTVVCLLVVTATRSLGALHYRDYQNQLIPADSDGIYVNPVTGAILAVAPSAMNTASWLNLFFGGTAIGSTTYIAPAITSAATGNGDGLVLKLFTLQEIGPALDYAAGDNGSEDHTGSSPGQFQVGVPGFIGYAMRTGANGPVSYGWMRITVNNNGSGIIHDSAYQDTPGVAVLAGSVPEPATGVLMLLTAAAVIFSRRR